MKSSIFIFLLSIAFMSSGSEVDRLLASYEKIETVSCNIRRSVSGATGAMTITSRIYWKQNGYLHVDNLTPVVRRIIADGTTFYSYAEGDPRGFSRPVSDLSALMTISLVKVPGTPMDHLLRMKDLEEIALPDQGDLRQFGYQAADQYIVLALDAQDRIASISFYKTVDQKTPIGTYRYARYKEVTPSVWVPLSHESSLTRPDGSVVEETVRVDRFVANEPVAQSLFDPKLFFEEAGIDFVDSFGDISKK